jgi:hypothetical protein
MADDLDWIVSTARRSDPSLDHVLAEELAAAAVRLAPGQDPAAVARGLLEAYPAADVSQLNVVARAAVDYLGHVD